MRHIEHFELSAGSVVALQIRAGSALRVTRGRLWLTLAGQPNDIWLLPDQCWVMPVHGTLWLSAEPVAEWQLVQAAPVRLRPRWHQTLVWQLQALAAGLKAAAVGVLIQQVPHQCHANPEQIQTG